PRLADRYFQSRPVSDMAERGHSLHELRVMPRVLGSLVRAVLALRFTAPAIAWVHPPALPRAVGAAAAAVLLPFLLPRSRDETDLRIRTHSGALNRFYLDALLGLAPLRAHAAERAVRRDHEGLLVEWSRSTAEYVRTSVRLDAVQAAIGLASAFVLVQGYA